MATPQDAELLKQGVPWQDKIFHQEEGKGENTDIKNLNRLRTALQGVKTAYYPGAGADYLPLALCPSGSTVVMQSLDYNPRHQFFQGDRMQTWMQRGILDIAGLEKYPEAKDFDPTNPVLDIHLAGDITVKFVGDSNDQTRNIPPNIDMIYAPPLTPNVSPIAYNSLNVGGLVLIVDTDEHKSEPIGQYLGIKLDDLPSFQKREITINELPSVLQEAATYSRDISDMTFNIYKKVKNLSRYERTIFEVESAIFYGGFWREWYKKLLIQQNQGHNAKLHDYEDYYTESYFSSLSNIKELLSNLTVYAKNDSNNAGNYKRIRGILQEYLDEYENLDETENKEFPS